MSKKKTGHEEKIQMNIPEALNTKLLKLAGLRQSRSGKKTTPQDVIDDLVGKELAREAGYGNTNNSKNV